MRGSFEYRTVCWWRHYRSRWRHIKKRLGRSIDFGLNFNLIKKFWGFPYHSPHNKVKRTPYFYIFYSTKNRDIDSKSINKGLFLAKSSTENSISLSVFWNFDVWYSCELMISLANKDIQIIMWEILTINCYYNKRMDETEVFHRE